MIWRKKLLGFTGSALPVRGGLEGDLLIGLILGGCALAWPPLSEVVSRLGSLRLCAPTGVSHGFGDNPHQSEEHLWTLSCY